MPHLRVSVLIPTYNRAEFLSDAIDSLLAQTRVPDEIIVVDDGSSDDTERVLGQYAGRIQALRQPNQGPSAARNAAFRASSGDLIAFLDSDDTLAPTSIQCRAEFLELHPYLNIVYTGAFVTNAENKLLGLFRKPPLPHGMIFHELICRHAFPIHAVMLRRTCIETPFLFDPQLRSDEDYDLWARLSAHNVVAAIDEPLCFYHLHSGTITERMDAVTRNGILVQERVMRMPEFAALPMKSKSPFYTVCGTRHLRLGSRREARRYFLQAITCDPRYRRAYLMLMLSLFGRSGYEYALTMYKRMRILV